MLRMGAPLKGSDGYEDGYDWEDWDLRAVTIFNPLQSRFSGESAINLIRSSHLTLKWHN